MSERRAGVLLASMLVLCCAAPLTAQTRQYLFYFQGDQHFASGFVVPTDNGYRAPAAGTQLLPLASGDEVCVRFVNGHPVKYGYSLGVTVDTTAYALPDLAAQLALLQPLLKGLQVLPAAADSAKALTMRGTRDPLAWYVGRLTTLAADLDSARSIALRSDASESPAQAVSPPESLATGFRWARWTIAERLPGGEGRFRDELLQAHLAAWAAAAMDTAGSDADRRTLARALASYGALLLTARDQIRGAYTTGPVMPEACAKVGGGPTTMLVTVARKDSVAYARRFAGVDSGSAIVIRPPYVRELVSVHPIAFGAFAGNVPHFAVDAGGVLRAPRDDASTYRVGAMIDVNLASFGPRKLLGAGLGLGVGTAGKDNLLSDLFLAGVLSVADKLRIGVGYGVSDFPSSVKGGTPDQAFDLKGQKLDDLIENSSRRALQLIFVLPGLQLK